MEPARTRTNCVVRGALFRESLGRPPMAQGKLSEALGRLRALMDSERVGALSTLSLHCPGWPFGSLTPFALTAKRAPCFVLSDLAEHTRNLRADPRASLLITDSAARGDPQSGARVTLVGTVSRVTETTLLPELLARWSARMPEGRTQLATPDFGVYVLSIENVRFIGGFATVCWVSARDLESLEHLTPAGI